MSASIKIDLTSMTKIGARVQKFLSNLSDTYPLMDAIGVGLVSNVQQRFESGSGPGGAPWDKANRGGQTLVESGILRDSITYDANDNSVRVGTNRIYAKTHQFGATIKPKNGKLLAFKIGGVAVFAKSVTIQARPFLGIDDGDIASIRGTLADFVIGARQGAI